MSGQMAIADKFWSLLDAASTAVWSRRRPKN